ncbi:hypothetical protein [Oxalobacter vibrioformis]|uniref:hypothetical protein n=1 Tax=Oxalobacter vibrioformis TaxID=933080 RepID=UPI0038CD3E85
MRIHEVSELSIQELRRLMGDERSSYSAYKGVAREKKAKPKKQRQVSALRKNHSSGYMITKTNEGKDAR